MQQAAPGQAQAAGAASKLTRVRHRKAVLASGALTNTVQAALKALQVSSHGKAHKMCVPGCSWFQSCMLLHGLDCQYDGHSSNPAFAPANIAASFEV
jgi:hypothetical protein